MTARPADPLSVLSGADGTARSKASASELLVAIAAAGVFRAADGDTAFATLAVAEHHETWPLRSKGFRRWLVGMYYQREGKPPGGQAVADALGVIEARA